VSQRTTIAVVGGVAVLFIIAAILHRKKGDHPGLIQIRLDPHGCVQHDMAGGPTWFAEILPSYAWLLTFAAAGFLIWAYHNAWIDRVFFWIWFPLSAPACVFLWFYGRRFRAALKQVGDNAIADRNTAVYRPTPWHKIRDFMLGQQRENVYRLRMDKHFLIFTEYPIDAEIRCTPEQAADLRQWLKRRIRR
jgi:hypothetical protein